MTDNDKRIIIKHAQEIANNYFCTPQDRYNIEIKTQFMAQFFCISELYYKLTGKRLEVIGNDHEVKEA